MGEKRMVTVRGRTMSLSDWAKEVGVSRQRMSQLYNEGRAEDWLFGFKRNAGRPKKSGLIKEALKIPRTLEEICEIADCCPGTVYRYVKENNVTVKDGMYVESD